MKDKIIARLKEKYPNVNLSKARLDAIADKMKVTEESEIDGKLDELNEIFPFGELAKQDDRIRGLDKKDQKPADEKKPDSQPAPGDSVPSDAPDWMKTFMQTMTTQVASVVSEVNAIKSGKATDTRKSQLEEILKDAPETYKNRILKDFARIPFEKDEDFTGYLDEIKADLPTIVQTEANNGLGKFIKPIVPTGGNQTSTATAEQAAAIIKTM